MYELRRLRSLLNQLIDSERGGYTNKVLLKVLLEDVIECAHDIMYEHIPNQFSPVIISDSESSITTFANDSISEHSYTGSC